jgi:spore coat polysaccharide biosynthesis protein SpsF
MTVLAITQARIGSTRLPAKILKEVNGSSLLEIHLARILRSTFITKLKVATTTESGTQKIIDIAEKLGVETYQGSVDDVLDRFYQTAKPETPDYVVRLTSDCPLIDPDVIDLVIKRCIESGCDYASNVLSPTFPDGMDVEVFKFSALEKAHQEAQLTSDKEHVTPYIWRNSTFKGGSLFQSINVESPIDYSEYRITVDTIDDFYLVENIINHLGVEKTFQEYVKYIETHHSVKQINQQYARNEGYEKSLLKD